MNEIKRQYVDREKRGVDITNLRLKSNHLRLRPRGERVNHRESRAREPNVEEIMISGRKGLSVSTPRSILEK